MSKHPDSWKLESKHNGKVFNFDVELLSSTPIEIYISPHAPINLTIKTEKKDYLFKTIISDILKWQGNPDNQGIFNITRYNIYRRIKGGENYTLFTSVDGNTFQYINADVGNNLYEYAISSVSEEGYESNLVFFNTQNQNNWRYKKWENIDF